MMKINSTLNCATALAAALSMAAGIANAAPRDTKNRLENAAVVFTEIMQAPDKAIPDDLLRDSHCVIVIPGFKKGGFVLSGQYGKGFMTCRKGGSWSAPAAIRAEGGGVGFQIGGSESDLVMLVMNARGAEKLMESEFALGGEAGIAAGPVGRDAKAATDAKMHAQILSYSRSRGLFAGVAITGGTLRTDEDDNRDLYGKKMNTKEVIQGSVSVPESGRSLINLLTRYSPVEQH